jgi:hypothetical protein
MTKLPRTSEQIFRHFRGKYRFGELGLFESIQLASTQVEGVRFPLSSGVISPPGEAKSDILREVLSMFPESTHILVDGGITEYHIAEKKAYEDLNYKLFCLNDIEDIIKAYPRRRVAGILGFLKNLIDGHGQILTKNDTIDRRADNFAVLLNIPEYLLLDSKGKLRNQFLATFFDRTIPFHFKTDWEKWKPYWNAKKLKTATLDKIELERHPVKWDYCNFRKKISREASGLATLKYSGLPRNINLIKAFLCGSALLNGRDRICNEDFVTLEMMKPFFGWYR